MQLRNVSLSYILCPEQAVICTLVLASRLWISTTTRNLFPRSVPTVLTITVTQVIMVAADVAWITDPSDLVLDLPRAYELRPPNTN